MDFRNDIGKNDNNILIYGHNMHDGSMFTDVVKYKNKKFFENNSIIYFDTLHSECRWEVFSVYVTDTKFDYLKIDFNTSDEYLQFLNTVNEKSMFKKQIELTKVDRILTLSTCSYEFKNARTVVHARLIGN